MEMHQLQYFVKAAELGGFTRAAEACFVSQPTLSQAVAKLEHELEQPLFERLGRRIQLTEAGHMLLERAQKILSLVEEARQAISHSDDEGRLIIGAIPTIAPYLLPPVLTRFAKQYPKARVELQEDVTAKLLRKCLEAEIDLAVMALPVDQPRLTVQPLYEEELLLVMPKGHALAERKSVSLADLEPHPLVLLNDAHCLSEQITAYCRRKQVGAIGTERVEQLATVVEVVALGHGV
jgi:LysR family hydrogen peroxide-inducible transcriptional activator